MAAARHTPVAEKELKGLKYFRLLTPFLDRLHARLLEMLIRTRADSEPCIIGQVQEPAGALPLGHCFARKNRFIANER